MLIPRLGTTHRSRDQTPLMGDGIAGRSCKGAAWICLIVATLMAAIDAVPCTRHDGTTVILSDVPMQPRVALTGTPGRTEIADENAVGSLELALARASEILGRAVGQRAPDLVSSSV